MRRPAAATQEATRESAAAAEVEGSETSQQSPAPAPQFSQAGRKARIDQYTADELDKIQDDELPLYFKEAEELSRHFTDMEEHNLFLMQNCYFGWQTKSPPSSPGWWSPSF